MDIKLVEVTVREITNGYVDANEDGVTGYGGKLNIRPKYQREFIYKPAQRDAVVNTVTNSFPLNTMYWVKNGDSYEVLDGQQRTVSICQYVNGDFSVNYQYFHNLEKEEQEQILDYKLMIYFCEGTDKEKLDWFQVINIAGEKLTKQELRNAIYTGEWLTDAKKHFSKTGCPAYNIGSDLVKGSPIRQDYLQTSIDWISDEKSIEDYMSEHQHDSSASALWLYFRNVISWVETIFPEYRKEMKGIDWGTLYNEFKDEDLDVRYMESRIHDLMKDEDVTKKSGIYPFMLTGKERYLSIRAFTANQKRESYERQSGVCPACKDTFELSGMEADHITPWSQGGTTTKENCQMLCKACNRTKSDT